MLNALNFVKGGIAKNDIIPMHQHFIIQNGYIQSSNGFITLNAPMPLDIEANPKAKDFLKAVNAVKNVKEDGSFSITLTKGKKLSIKSGRLKVFVECMEGLKLSERPLSDIMPVWDTFIDNIRELIPLISEDTNQLWANGMLIKNGFAYVANNSLLIEKNIELGYDKEINIPKATLVELLRINECPESIQILHNCIVFSYKGNRWLKSALLSPHWPDPIDVLETYWPDQHPLAVDNMGEWVKDLLKFKTDDNLIHLRETEMTVGNATISYEQIPLKGTYNIQNLANVLKISKEVSLYNYHKAGYFRGDGMRGAIMGVRL